MKKKLFAILMTTAMITSLTACGQKENSADPTPPSVSDTKQEDRPTSELSGEPLSSDDEKITLRFSWWGGDARHEATLAAIEAYQKSHPNITIEPEYSSFSGYYEKLVTQLASGNAPDFFQVDQGWVAELYARGDAFADFKNYGDVIDLTTIPDSMMIDYCTIDDQAVVLPLGYNGTVFLYNRTLLADWCDDSGNLDIKTWGDFNRIGNELHEKDPEAYMTTAITDGYLRFILKPMLEQITGKIDVQDDFTLGFTEEEMSQAFDSFLTIFTENTSQPYEEAVLYDTMQNNPLWLKGKIGGIFLFFSNIDTEIAGLPYDYGVAGMPMFADSQLSGQECCPSLMVAVNKNTDTAHQIASAEFIDWFLNSEEAALILGTVRGVPGSEKALATLEENHVLSDLMTQGVRISNNTLSLKNGAYELNSSVKAVFVEYMEKAIYGVLSPQEASKGMVADLEKVLANLEGN